ncbi:hypothetical protein C2W62_26470 [Candidatus Entotheonella serta]|nr:hypothetical protein C2W62_26470 [Candidatus Entotheonella serta]
MSVGEARLAGVKAWRGVVYVPTLRHCLKVRRKHREYFEAGVRLVWLLDLKTRSVDVYTDVNHVTTRHETDTLNSGKVLPGLALA